MSQIITGQDDFVRSAVTKLMKGDAVEFGPSTTIGIASSDRSKFYAGIVYHSWDKTHGTLCFTLGATTPKWATRGNIRAMLSYPFDQLGVNKLMACIASDNGSSLRLATVPLGNGVRFTREAILRHQFGKGRHGMVYSLMADEWQRSQRPRVVMKEAA